MQTLTDSQVLEIIQRKTTIPNPSESFDKIEAAFDRAAEIIQQHIERENQET